ncbi:MAG: hypothetical protein GX102_02970 [Porphyromonadaceae bacterium]|jgi:hypothetical protein|nr:hypothetical protein [Porphyromonadaceae bacterium]
MEYIIQQWWTPLLFILFVFDLVMKGFALWKAARNNHLAWFICIIVLNTAGILPIIYLLTNKAQTKE